MRVRSFLPCEKVVKRRNGSIDILGFGIRKISLQKKENSQFAEALINFMAEIEFEAGEEGEKTIEVKFLGPDGEHLSRSPGINIKIPPKGGGINVGGELPLKTTNSGDHVLKLIVSGSVKADCQ